MLTDDYLLACSELNLSLWLCCYRDVEGGAYIRLLRWDERLSTCCPSQADFQGRIEAIGLLTRDTYLTIQDT